MARKRVTLKKGKDRPIKNKNHWIFSGAIHKRPRHEDGEIMDVFDFEGNFLGYGYFHNSTSIAGRMLSFDDTDIDTKVRELIARAAIFRSSYLDTEMTNCYRVINGEGDSFPGLVVDKYNDVLVIQVSTVGVEKLKPQIIAALDALFDPRLIFERSDFGARSTEGLPEFTGPVYGDESNSVAEVIENGHKFLIDVANSHKTGFYLDQRNMRQLVGKLSRNKSLLNCFSYTGGFSVYAAANDASKVDSVDISSEVIEQAKQNFTANDLDPDSDKYNFFAEDVFKFLRRQKRLDYDIVILDPPAFAKTKKDVRNATNGYRDINRLAIDKMPSGSYLLTCSCSYHVDELLFQKIVFQAASDTNKQVKIVQKHHLAEDHPLNIYHPDNDYLKSLLLRID